MLNYYIAVHQRKTKLSTKRENKSCRRNGKKDFVDDTGKKLCRRSGTIKSVSTKREDILYCDSSHGQ